MRIINVFGSFCRNYPNNVKSTDLQIDFVEIVLHIPNFLLSLQNRKNYYKETTFE